MLNKRFVLLGFLYAAYNALVKGLVLLLQESIDLIDEKNILHFYIDGGFAANNLFYYYLQELYPNKKIIAVDFPQATALGAYLFIKGAV